jgi:hypothetical protein
VLQLQVKFTYSPAESHFIPIDVSSICTFRYEPTHAAKLSLVSLLLEKDKMGRISINYKNKPSFGSVSESTTLTENCNSPVS